MCFDILSVSIFSQYFFICRSKLVVKYAAIPLVSVFLRYFLCYTSKFSLLLYYIINKNDEKTVHVVIYIITYPSQYDKHSDRCLALLSPRSNTWGYAQNFTKSHSLYGVKPRIFLSQSLYEGRVRGDWVTEARTIDPFVSRIYY